MEIKEHLDLVHYEIPRLVDSISNKFGVKIRNKSISVLCLTTLFKDLLFTMKALQSASEYLPDGKFNELFDKALKAIYSDHTTILLAVNGIDVNIRNVNEDLKKERIPEYMQYLNIEHFLYEEFYTLLKLLD